MILELKVIDDNGEVKAFVSGPAQSPLQWKAPVDKPIIIEREGNNGAFYLWSLTVQPQVVLNLQHKKAGNFERPTVCYRNDSSTSKPAVPVYGSVPAISGASTPGISADHRSR